MATIVTTDVVNGTPTDAGVINGNFNAVKAVVNGGLTNDNVSGSASVAVSKLAPSSTEGHVVTTSGGVAVWAAPPASGGGGGGTTNIPVGAGTDYWGSTAPAGWVFADASAVSRTTYASLFAVLGTTHGSGDGSTTFNLPDKRARVSVMKGTISGISAIGDNDGVTLANRRPQHRHTAHAHGFSFRSSQGAGGSTPTAGGSDVPNYSASTSAADGGSGVANDPLDAPAYIVCNYIIYAGV